MSRPIIFSQKFPSYHISKGKETFFIEKLFAGFLNLGIEYNYSTLPLVFLNDLSSKKLTPKYHTIRAGNRWKPGDKFSPRCWSGKPYRSKQIILAPDIEIKKVWSIEIECHNQGGMDIWLNGQSMSASDNQNIAKNDGLYLSDFFDWFNKDHDKELNYFEGQLICWNKDLNYL
jgi:hypothetical protein